MWWWFKTWKREHEILALEVFRGAVRDKHIIIMQWGGCSDVAYLQKSCHSAWQPILVCRGWITSVPGCRCTRTVPAWDLGQLLMAMHSLVHFPTAIFYVYQDVKRFGKSWLRELWGHRGRTLPERRGVGARKGFIEEMDSTCGGN